MNVGNSGPDPSNLAQESNFVEPSFVDAGNGNPGNGDADNFNPGNGDAGNSAPDSGMDGAGNVDAGNAAPDSGGGRSERGKRKNRD